MSDHLRQHLSPFIPRHMHAEPYAALVLEGGYEEAGDGGRFRVESGDVVVHGGYCAHQDRAPGRAVVLNLPLPMSAVAISGVGRTADPDAVIRLARRDAAAAGVRLLAEFGAQVRMMDDAPDALARRLERPGAGLVADCSADLGISRVTAFRWFRQVYGVAPARYRVEARARRAWRRLVLGEEGLAAVAAAEGFADQAHMSRDVRALTGRSPGDWRRWARLQHFFKTRAD